MLFFFFFSSRRRHTRFKCDWSSDVCSSDLPCSTTTAVLRAGRLLPRGPTPLTTRVSQGCPTRTPHNDHRSRMRIVYFDCPSGAAGDMIMAALVDAGAPLDALRAELKKLPLGGFKLVAREVRKGGFRATKVDVEIDRGAHQHHRSLTDILGILESSGLAPALKEKAARIFTRLAGAEARAH